MSRGEKVQCQKASFSFSRNLAKFDFRTSLHNQSLAREIIESWFRLSRRKHKKDRRENRNSDKNWPLLSATNLVLLSLSLLSDNLQHTQTLFISPCPTRERRERERETYPLDDLGLFNEESANDSVSDAVGATRSTVSTLNSLLSLGDLSVFTGSESGNLQNQSNSVISMFSDFGKWERSKGRTYTGESDVAVTALGGSGGLLDLDEAELST